MKIITWNVNWIRAVFEKWFLDFFKKENPDILCLQETKAFEDQLPEDLKNLTWYKYVFHSWERKWYAWTMIFYKESLDIIEVKNIFPGIDRFHTDWRVTQIETSDFVLINGYFPNWWDRADGTEMLSYKLWFYDDLIKYCNELKASWKNVIITWDYNICHTEIDIARPKQNANVIWFLPIERDKVSEFLNTWFTDVFRYLKWNITDVYSWWSYRAWARPNNVWWRIDYFSVNNEFLDNVIDIEYMTNVMWSDHCPVKLILK